MTRTMIVALVLLFLAWPVQGEEVPPKMTPEQQAMMEAWIAAGTPGEHHGHLKPMEGTFTATSTMWQAPGAPPETSEGTSKNTLVLDGRFLMQEYDSQFMGQPFTGLGFTGYDNLGDRYVGSWMDSMTTQFMTSEGHCSDGGKSWEFTGDYVDPVSKETRSTRQTLVLKSDDEHVFAMYEKGPDGKEFKAMEIVYTRTK